LANGKALPNFTYWTQEPIVSVQGLFISTQRALHYFPSHGYEKKYKHQVWRPNEEEVILSIAIEKTKNPSILIKDNCNELVILEGNVQSGDWGAGERRYETGIKASNGAYLITSEKYANEYWIYDGLTLVRYQTTTREVVSSITIKGGKKIPFYFDEKLKFNYFTPFITVDKQTTLKAVIPITTSLDDKVRVGVLPDGNTLPRMINDEDQHLWVKAYPGNGGFSLGLSESIKGYVGDQVKWRINKPKTTSFPAIMMKNWLATLVQFNTIPREGAKATSAIIFIPASLIKGNYTPDERKIMTGHIDVDGMPIPGLPPLYYNGDIFIALRDRKITTIYQIHVSG